MKKILLPNGLEISEVALGAMMFGSTTSKEDSYAILDAFLDLGGNFIDTSNNYAHWIGTGDESETLLGEYFAMIMIVDMSKANEELAAIAKDCEELGKKIGMSIHLQHEDIFNAMHTV